MGETISFVSPFVELFQIENLMAAMLTVHASGIPLQEIAPHTASLETAQGRLEVIHRFKEGGKIYIDYAHTPAALETILSHLKKEKTPKTLGRFWLRWRA